jgi:hypothetical protein
MQLQNDESLQKYPGEDKPNSDEITQCSEQVEVGDTDPPLDEEDLEENDLTVEEADQIVWDSPKTSSAGSEEKDITD